MNKSQFVDEISQENPCGLNGIEFVEFASPEPEKLDRLFLEFGFSKLQRHRDRDIVLYRQNDMVFLLNREAGTQAAEFSKAHGPSICSMGWRVADSTRAMSGAVERGAETASFETIYKDAPAIFGIGRSLIYFIEPNRSYLEAFVDLEAPVIVRDKGFLAIDHLTNNVVKGTRDVWADFYKKIFGFTEVRYFDIRGAKTGLTSFALRSPDGSFCIPINEGTEEASQIEEYLREYDGPGVQHIAFLTIDLLGSLDRLSGSSIETLDIDDEYYDTVFDRVPNVREDRARIRNHNVLVDGDDEGYLLQIFTKNIIGPIFIEMIQRENHFSFGEGNFGALFRSIERDQQARGVL
ncbi:MAG: 4-hydroxyphenylpyruvate dioxygenase [Candidatus Eisenbacteria bacterium]|uniref:4-hydroxyphenylpyruvate dioxygenase n=1 Tax=Eiseniibacteriota bacterium TaxID=2212470 RepID=A0A7Y2H2R8_UNCEI|nr:4-hydroxyphenylpyruvate dioxygenase [Candidatus Eisenbacteria bacterium]